MRIVPERKSIFDDLFDDAFAYSRNGLMRTDVRKKDGYYMLDVELPGYKKEDIKISLFNGNLTISAEHHETEEEKDNKGFVVRQERYYGNCSRTFYVGDTVRQTDVHAAYNNGILTVTVPTAEKKEAEEKKFIDIQ